jgi:hypothetical protein
MENLMARTNFLSVALIAAAVLITPAMARPGRLAPHDPFANARVATTVHAADQQTGVRDRPSDLHGSSERDPWGHWGAYYGPMVVAP